MSCRAGLYDRTEAAALIRDSGEARFVASDQSKMRFLARVAKRKKLL
jgi:hypothetical protein